MSPNQNSGFIKNVEWIIEPTGSGSIEVTVEAMSHKGGRDQKKITIKQ